MATLVLWRTVRFEPGHVGPLAFVCYEPNQKNKQKQKEVTMKKNNIPALRFPQFNEPWTMKKLGEVGELLCGFAFKGSDILENGGNFKLMRGVNISEGFVRHSEDIDRFYSNSIDKLEKYKLKRDDLVI
ncbi:MAG: hypothetical protein ACRCZQ_06090, partial [Bacteroidales bacterium]